jgi:hypothetical protein
MTPTNPKDEPKKEMTMTVEDLQKLIHTAIAAAREPDEETKQKREEERAAKEARMQAMILEGKQAEQTAAAQKNCRHTKQNGETTIHNGQIYSDGKIRPLCIRCGKIFQAYDAPRELVTGTGF